VTRINIAGEDLSCRGGLFTLLSYCILPETVLEPSRDMFEVPHPASSCGLSALGLLSPLVGTQLRTGIAALRAVLVLFVEGTVTAAAAKRMRLGVALTK